MSEGNAVKIPQQALHRERTRGRKKSAAQPILIGYAVIPGRSRHTFEEIQA